VLAEDLISAGLGRVEMLVEHSSALSSKRIDVVLAGQHPRRGAPSYLVVELKQWSAGTRWEDEPSLVASRRTATGPSCTRWRRSGLLRVPRALHAALHDCPAR
jgi:hypothetical protein